MVRTGVVIEEKDGLLTLLFDRPEACEKCGQCNGRTHNATLELPGQARVGERVSVELPDGRLAQATLLAYALPVVLLLLGLVFGQRMFGFLPIAGDLRALMGGGVGVLLGLLLMAVSTRGARAKAHFSPRIVGLGDEGE